MPVWEKATIVSGAPGGRVTVDAGGNDYVKFLAPQFRKNDGSDYGLIGFGVDVVGEADNDPLAPAAPILTWDTDGSDNTPSFTADFDDSKVVAGGSIDGSNYDVIHLQYSTDSGFSGASTADNTLDASEVLAGEVAFTTGALADGLWYARCRHEHVVAGVSHFSPWSNTVSQTIAASNGRLLWGTDQMLWGSDRMLWS